MEIICGNIRILKPDAGVRGGVGGGGFMAAGDVILGHQHEFDHTTICFAGALRVNALWPEGPREAVIKSPRKDWDGPSHLLIEAGIRHELIALEDDTVFWCVYAHRTPDGCIEQQSTGWGEPSEGTQCA